MNKAYMWRWLRIAFSSTPYTLKLTEDAVLKNVIKANVCCHAHDEAEVVSTWEAFKYALKEEHVDGIPPESCIKHVLDELINVANMGDCQSQSKHEVLLAVVATATDLVRDTNDGENESTRLFHDFICAVSQITVLSVK